MKFGRRGPQTKNIPRVTYVVELVGRDVDSDGAIPETVRINPVETRQKPAVGKVKKAALVGMGALAFTGGPETSGPELPHTPIEYAEAVALPYADCEVTAVKDDHGLTKKVHGSSNGKRTTVNFNVATTNTRAAEHTYGKYKDNDDVGWYAPAGAGWILQRQEDGTYKRQNIVSGSGVQQPPFNANQKDFYLSPRVDYASDTRMLVTVQNEVRSYDTEGLFEDRVIHDRVGETPCGWLAFRDGEWKLAGEPLPLELAAPQMLHSKDTPFGQ